MQPPRRHKAISAVVSLATENHNPPGRSMVRENVVSNRRTGVLHQRERRHPKALAGSAINASHLFGRNDFHNKDVVSRWSSVVNETPLCDPHRANDQRPILKQKGPPRCAKSL